MKTETYTCNLCRNPISDRTGAVALYFSNNWQFKLTTLDAETDVHVCVNCIHQIREQTGLKPQ